MSLPTREELLRRFPKIDDPEILARRRQTIEALLEATPQVRQQFIEEGRREGRLIEARVVLRIVLARRQLALGPDDDARIEACNELAILQRWHDLALTAVSVADALA